VNRLLPKTQQRRIDSSVSINAVLDLPDETRNIADFKKITGHERITLGAGGSAESRNGSPTTPSISAVNPNSNDTLLEGEAKKK
jgi:hypothetical protein